MRTNRVAGRVENRVPTPKHVECDGISFYTVRPALEMPLREIC